MPTRITEDSVLGLIGLIYDAAGDRTRWPEFLEAFAQCVGAGGTLIYTHNVETSQASTEVDGAALNAAVNFDPDFVQSLGEYYNHVNIWAQNESLLKPGRAVTGSMLYPVRLLPKTEFYNDWLRPQDFFHAVGGLIVQDGPWASKFSALRSKRDGDYSAEEVRLYETLLPHLARAARLQRQFAFLQSLATSSLEVLDTVAAAVMLLDAQGRLRHFNSTAEEQLRRGDPLVRGMSGELRVRRGGRAQAELSALIGSTIDPSVDASKSPSALRLSRRNGEVLSVHALPVSRRLNAAPASPLSQGLIACALIVHEGAATNSGLGPDVLQKLYGLTPAEVRVVLAIARGDTLKEYSERRGISWHTASSQLKRVYEKTGIRRQSELVRWLLQGDRRVLPEIQG